MARQKGRGGGGFRPPELRGTLGTLLRTTLQQAGAVRDAARGVLERGAREGRSRLDEARTNRRRQDALAELGEVVLQLIRDGEIDVAELPEAAEIVRHLDDLDDGVPASEADDDTVSPPSRRRFDDRGGDDGTVSSGARSSPPPPRAAAPARVWRPPSTDPRDRIRDETPTIPPPTRRPRDPARKGGIRFDAPDDPDADLAEYMHPDDVPPKPSK
jgi:hypothetical protein